MAQVAYLMFYLSQLICFVFIMLHNVPENNKATREQSFIVSTIVYDEWKNWKQLGKLQALPNSIEYATVVWENDPSNYDALHFRTQT